MSKNSYLNALLSSGLSIFPMLLIIVVLSFIPNGASSVLVPLEPFDYLALAICAVVLIVGLALFQIGANGGLTRVGEYMGGSLSNQKKMVIVIVFAFLLGALITCAEPSIMIVSSQVSIPEWLLVGSIAIGVGAFVVIGVVRIYIHKSLKLWYLLFYFIVFGLICLIGLDESTRKFLPFIFDAGGITTGSATVPFILALGAGIAAVRGGTSSTEDSFGLVGMASIGPILTMTILIICNNSGFTPYEVSMAVPFDSFSNIMTALGMAFLPSAEGFGTLIEVAMALLPILIIFLIYELIYIRLPKDKMLSIGFGFIISFFGLVIFLAGINAFMQPFGNRVGVSLGLVDNDWLIILICFIIGLVTILCEPAVHSLTTQIVSISDGAISKKTVLLTLSLGVGIAIGLSAIRTLFNFNILYIVVPGYILSCILMFFCPDLFTALAFDSGGTASGPMSVSFVLPMIIGITYQKNVHETSSVLYYDQSFGVVALIALTPILAVQILGISMTLKKMYQLRVMRHQVFDANDAQIIHF